MAKVFQQLRCLEVESPYLWHQKTGDSTRPVKDQLGIEHSPTFRTLNFTIGNYGDQKLFLHKKRQKDDESA